MRLFLSCCVRVLNHLSSLPARHGKPSRSSSCIDHVLRVRAPFLPTDCTLNHLTGILDAAELPEDFTKPFLSSFRIILPSSESIGAIWPDSQQLVALPQGLQRTISSPVNASYIGFRLLGILVESCFALPQSVASYSAFETLRPWALSSCLDLWSSFTNWTAGTQRETLDDDMESSYLQSLSMLALPSADKEQSWSSNVMTLFTSGLIDAIRTCSLRPFSQANQARLAYVLIRLQSILPDVEDGTTEKSRCVKAFLIKHQILIVPRLVYSDCGSYHQSKLTILVRDSMLPEISRICYDITHFKALQKDLRVCVVPRVRSLIAGYGTLSIVCSVSLSINSLRYAFGPYLVAGQLRSKNFGFACVRRWRIRSKTMNSTKYRLLWLILSVQSTSQTKNHLRSADVQHLNTATASSTLSIIW